MNQCNNLCMTLEGALFNHANNRAYDTTKYCSNCTYRIIKSFASIRCPCCHVLYRLRQRKKT